MAYVIKELWATGENIENKTSYFYLSHLIKTRHVQRLDETMITWLVNTNLSQPIYIIEQALPN